jgi:hypothetical protein
LLQDKLKTIQLIPDWMMISLYTLLLNFYYEFIPEFYLTFEAYFEIEVQHVLLFDFLKIM